MSWLEASYQTIQNWSNEYLGSSSGPTPSGPDDYILKNDRIMGCPPRYLPSTDPGDRCYNNIMMERAPVVGIVPGVPKRNSISRLTNNEKANLRRIQQLANSGDDSEENARRVAALFSGNRNKSASSIPSAQYYKFDPAYGQYYKYVQTMLMALSAMIDQSNTSNSAIGNWFYRFSDDFDPGFGDRSLSFWVERQSSITDNATNEYGESQYAGLRNENVITKGAKELGFVTGINRDQDPDADVGGVLGSVSGAVKSAATGGKILFPLDWQNSTYNKDISLSFKFTSPYGDPGSIFEYVYKPFICLLALTLPRQSAESSYTSPFILRVDSPGWFNSDMCAVSSFTYKKGGSDDLWSVDNLPLSIEVTLGITDLMPTLMMANRHSAFLSNPSFHTFFMNMAGVRSTDPFARGEAVAKAWAAGAAQFVDPDSYIDWGKNLVKDQSYKVVSDNSTFLGGLTSALGL